MQRIKLITKIGRKALPHRGGNGKIPGGIPHLRHHHDDGLDTDRTGKPENSVKRLFTCGMSLTMNLVQNYSDHLEERSIHDRFIRDERFRNTMIEMGRTEEVIREMDKLANEDHTHHATEE